MIDVGCHTHVHDVVTGVSRDNNGIRVGRRKLILNGVEKMGIRLIGMLTVGDVNGRERPRKKVEDQLEFRIFHRRANSVVLTSEGEEFISHVREALDHILAAGMEIKDRKKSSVLKISVLPTFATRWLLPKLTETSPPR